MPPDAPRWPHSIAFEAIGTRWQLDTAVPIEPAVRSAIDAVVAAYDATWSRFRDDSLVARIAREPGTWRLPPEAGPLFALYRELYEATDGAVSPLVGRALESLGYDRAYSLRPSGVSEVVPAWDDAIAWDGVDLTTVRPVTVDIGAAGKGQLVDLVAEVLAAAGHDEFVIDASGDILHRGSGTLRVALEHPADPTRAIGIALVRGEAICASASNRRAWGDGLHHVIDAITGLPTSHVVATWAIAPTTMEADGLATALFLTEPNRLEARFECSWVRVLATGRVESSPHFEGELFS